MVRPAIARRDLRTLALILAAWLTPFGCAQPIRDFPVHPDGSAARFELYTTKSIEIDASGSVKTAEGRTFRLAGIRIRPVSETQEPDAVAGINRYLKRVGKPLELLVRQGSDEAVFFYQHRHRMADDYLNIINLFGPFYARIPLNELLIALGIARYEDKPDVMTVEDAARLREKYRIYELKIQSWAKTAVECRHSEEKIANWPVESVEQVCWNGGIYHSPSKHFMERMAPGDRERVVEKIKRIKSDPD